MIDTAIPDFGSDMGGAAAWSAAHGAPIKAVALVRDNSGFMEFVPLYLVEKLKDLQTRKDTLYRIEICFTPYP